MSLRDATFRGRPLALPGEPPYPAAALLPFVGKRLFLPCDDPWVRDTGDESHGYLDGARAGWVDHPEYMDFLDPGSPVFALKALERDLQLHHWARWLDAGTVLDVGCGIGRFTCALLDRGAVVHAIDPDLESLRRCAWHSAGRAGSLDLHWSSAHVLPRLEVDLAVAAEVLCYVPDAVGALRAIASRVRPGGTVLLSMEARWGWAASQDAPAASIHAALSGTGVVALPGDRWVKTYEADDVEELCAAAELEVVSLVASHWIPDGPLEDTAPADLDLPTLIALEDRCREHPVWGPLHRLWSCAAVKAA
jgi:2-polyprenyl-6-hydroxyphenyl methylase/3-demethylubiquinone-9 3-methyltransferase